MDFDLVKHVRKQVSEGSIELRPFDRNDWDAFSGAESPFEGVEPLTAEVKVLNWPEPRIYSDKDWDGTAKLIVDIMGVSLVGVNGSFNYETTFDEAREIVASLSEPIDAGTLENEGWVNDGNMEVEDDSEAGG